MPGIHMTEHSGSRIYSGKYIIHGKYYWKNDAFSNPFADSEIHRETFAMAQTLHTGGMPGKIRIAAAADVPVVTTTIGSENLPLRDGEECFLADSPAEFAGKRIQFLGDQMAWNNFSIKGRLAG